MSKTFFQKKERSGNIYMLLTYYVKQSNAVFKISLFRFYFKTEVDGDMCYEEETEDGHPVPLWEGKILVQCRLVD